MSVYDYSARGLKGEEVSLSAYKGRVLLIVNTASQCGFTPQYAGLEALQETYGPRGFDVLGFPCNQFGGQEPGTEAEIGTFCETRFGVTFPLFSKIEVNGPATHPLWAYLKKARPGLLGSEAVKWNFTKFLVNRSGEVVERFASTIAPQALAPKIEALLAEAGHGA